MRSVLPAVLAAAIAALLTPDRAAGQLRDLRVLTSAAATKAVAAAEAEARRNNWNVSIAVVDAAGELVAFLRMDGASPSSVDIAPAKARTAARFRRPTKAMEEAVAGGRTVLLSFPDVTPVEGGVPVIVNGQVVGAVGVSGVTSPQDAQVAQAGASAVAP
ncbi:MAG TPA: heme-binding protein [Gemmatimonadaceae bacterium]|jgi:glc operon protein GlcG|nr:heme-binding protein [Gemmatimonadaceae bacterium]